MLIGIGGGEGESIDDRLVQANCPLSSASSMLGDLSEALKLATKDAHELAENSEFMRNFLKGQVTRDQFKVKTREGVL